MIDAHQILAAANPYGELSALGVTLTNEDAPTRKLNKDRYQRTHIWTLPSPSGLDVTFSGEQLHHKMIKLFKSELEVGDPLFDDRVYVTTKTEATRALLVGNEHLQGAIMHFVGMGGAIAVSDTQVAISSEISESRNVLPDAHEELVLLAHLVAFIHRSRA